MATIDPSVAESRIRLACGDITDIPFLTDDVYTYCLSTQLGNENAATRMAAQLILAQLAYGTHERIGAVERYGSEAFNNYVKFIKQVITNPSYNAIGGIYCAGVDLADVQANIQDATIVQKSIINYPANSYDDSSLNKYGVVTANEDNAPYGF